MTGDEAKSFGVPFPLDNGWFIEYADSRLSEEEMIKLYTVALTKSKGISGKRLGEPSNLSLINLKITDALMGLFGSSGIFDSVVVTVEEIPTLTKRQARKAKLKVKRLTQKAQPKKAPKASKARVSKTTVSSVNHIISKSSIDVTSDAFLQSFECRALRMQALKLHGAKCQCCGASPSTGAVMNVDHIKPRKFYPELALVLSNLQILCGDCNHGKGNWDETDWRIIKN